MAICRSCKYLNDADLASSPDKAWCPVWENWQKIGAKCCKYYIPREYNKSNEGPRYKSQRDRR